MAVINSGVRSVFMWYLDIGKENMLQDMWYLDVAREHFARYVVFRYS